MILRENSHCYGIANIHVDAYVTRTYTVKVSRRWLLFNAWSASVVCELSRNIRSILKMILAIAMPFCFRVHIISRQEWGYPTCYEYFTSAMT